MSQASSTSSCGGGGAELRRASHVVREPWTAGLAWSALVGHRRRTPRRRGSSASLLARSISPWGWPQATASLRPCVASPNQITSLRRSSVALMSYSASHAFSSACALLGDVSRSSVAYRLLLGARTYLVSRSKTKASRRSYSWTNSRNSAVVVMSTELSLHRLRLHRRRSPWRSLLISEIGANSLLACSVVNSVSSAISSSVGTYSVGEVLLHVVDRARRLEGVLGVEAQTGASVEVELARQRAVLGLVVPEDLLLVLRRGRQRHHDRILLGQHGNVEPCLRAVARCCTRRTGSRCWSRPSCGRRGRGTSACPCAPPASGSATRCTAGLRGSG